ncbi:hypothetical protein VH571_04500 [Frondihabitans sp. 4ASC-45]|uniref:hypothetical protein n=1 Tax=Frondihabitans sp. 4ASC-45 TaxID=3111636 RepID=UPI003C248C70
MTASPAETEPSTVTIESRPRTASAAAESYDSDHFWPVGSEPAMDEDPDNAD